MPHGPVLLQGASPISSARAPQMGTPQRSQDLDIATPAAQPRTAASSGPWWTVYHDAQLDSLERQVRVTRQSLPQAEAAWRTAVGVARTAGPSTSLYPLLSAVRGASWDVELWDQVHHSMESRAGAAQVSEEELAAAQLAAQAALAVDYMGLRLADEQTQILKEMQANCQQEVDILASRYKTGTTNASEVTAARGRLAEFPAQLIGAELPRQELEHAIALLTAAHPGDFSIPGAKLAEMPRIPPQLPSSLLERRLDVAAAVRQLKAKPGAPGPPHFPSFMLSGQSAELRAILPGPDRAESENTTYGTAFGAYRRTALEALQQADGDLSILRSLQAQYEASGEAVAEASRALEILQQQFKSGQANAGAVLEAQDRVLAKKQTQLSVQHNYLVASVMLMEALGGGWDAPAVPAASER